MDPKQRLKNALEAADAVAKRAQDEGREFTDDERTAVEGHLRDAKAAKEQIAKADGDAQLKADVRDQLDALGLHAPDTAADDLERGQAPGKGKTLGEQFVNAPAFSGWLKSVAPNGRIADSAKGLMSPPVEFKAGYKDLITGAGGTSGGAFVESDRTGIYETLGRREVSVLDLIARRPTSSDTIEFVRQTARTNAAAPVAEASTSDAIGSGETGSEVTEAQAGVKPQSGATFQRITRPVVTIAHWMAATKRALSDVAQLRAIIDQELREGVREELEDQVVSGDGSGENFEGIEETPGTLEQAWDTSILVTTRKAKTRYRVVGRNRNPGAWLFHPSDWETVELLQDGQNRFYWGGPLAQGPPQLWGSPVATSEAVTEGTSWYGDFSKAVLFDREQTTVQATDSHADFFTRNLVAILAEMRAGFAVTKPDAFVEVPLSSS